MSLILTLVFVAVAAAMMQPGLHMLIALPILFALGFAVRWTARRGM